MAEASRALFGTETEYGVTALDAGGRLLPVDAIADQFFDRAAARPALPGSESGVFLSNGARFYIDGSHPEYASPETTNPWEAVRYALAGDSLMSQLAHEVRRKDPRLATLAVRKGNVDYGGRTTFASHENYLHHRPPAELQPALAPHLVSRIVFTGAGGFDPFNRRRSRFVLSPRALFMRSVAATSAPGGLALVDGRAQPHCAGFHRQHLVCADANRSHLSMFLRLGTTALVVALIDAGCAEADEVKLVEPLQALVTVARDTTLRQRLDLASGRQATALDIQRHYLRQARRNLDRLPRWADDVCDAWQDVLDRLEHGPDAVADRLDWAIKLAIYRDRARRRRDRWRAADREDKAQRSLFPWFEAGGWWARQCEIDLRYGQIYPAAVFEELDEAGVLRHRVPGVHLVEEAALVPPAHGRARIRGEVVMRLAGLARGVSCGWDGVYDFTSRRTLDLASPFVEVEAWRDFVDARPAGGPIVGELVCLATSLPSPAVTRSIRTLAERLGAWLHDRGAAQPSGEDAILLNNHAVSVRGAGRLDDAEWLMRAALTIDLAVRPAGHPKIPHRRNNLGMVLLMQGRQDEARQEVTLAWRQSGSRWDVTSVRILIVRLAIALVDGEPGELFVGQLKGHLAIQPLPDYADVDRRWHLGRALDFLAPRLNAEALELLRAVGAVSNGDRTLQSLGDIRCWEDAPTVPLETPWPVLSSGGGNDDCPC